MKKSRFFSAVLAATMICSFSAVSAYAAGNSELEPKTAGETSVPELTAAGNSENAEDIFEYEENADGTITITKGNFDNQTYHDVMIPETIDGKIVTGIGNSAFFGGKYGNLVFPNTLRSIGESAFQYSRILTETLSLPESLEYIGAGAFFETKHLTESKDEILEGEAAGGGYNGKLFSEITIPQNVKYIGWDAFGTQGWVDETTDGVQAKTQFNIYSGGYVEQYMKVYVPMHRDGAKAGYQYKIIGQTDIEPSQTESVNGLKISGAIPDGAEFKAVATTTKWFKDPIFCYEITLNKDGAVVQPDGYVTIYIPCEYSNGYVVHVDEETGEMENRNSIYVDGYYVFVTDHLSEYGIKFDSEPVKSEVSQPEQSQSEQSQPEQSQPEQSQPEQSQPEQSQPEQSQPEQPQSEQSQPEQSQPINPDNNVPKTGDSPITAAALIVTAAISGAFVLGIRKRNANHI